MNSTVNPKRIIATNIRTTAEQLDAWRDLYATTYPAHRLSFNAWMIARLNAAPILLAACERVLRAIDWSYTEDRMDTDEQASVLREAIGQAMQ